MTRPVFGKPVCEKHSTALKPVQYRRGGECPKCKIEREAKEQRWVERNEPWQLAPKGLQVVQCETNDTVWVFGAETSKRIAADFARRELDLDKYDMPTSEFRKVRVNVREADPENKDEEEGFIYFDLDPEGEVAYRWGA